VVGTVNVFEAARKLGIKRLAYASSIAAYGAMDEGHGAMHTLYGAYKHCDEQIALVYSEDWSVASVGIRPGVVYGVGRDQGLTSKTTVAILAAAAGKPYEVPFSAACPGCIPERWRARSSRGGEGAHRRPGLQHERRARAGREGLRILRSIAPSAKLTSSGEALAFPMYLPDQPLRDFLGDYGTATLAEGIRETYDSFRALLQASRISFTGA